MKKNTIFLLLLINRFQNLGILFIGKKEVQEILYKRKSLQISNCRAGGESKQFYQVDQQLRQHFQLEAEKESKDMNLNSVRICFEAFMLCEQQQQPDSETKQFVLRSLCPPVYSKPIANQSKQNSLFPLNFLFHLIFTSFVGKF